MSGKRKNKDDYLKDCQQIARTRGGKCLSKKYINTHTKLEWECAEGHKWMAKPSKIKSARWCPECAIINRNNRRKLTIEQMQLIAKERGGKCLSKEYVNNHTKLKWMCSKGHQWNAIYCSIQGGKWCPECGKQKSILSRCLSIEDAQKLAKKRGGKCLSKKYERSSGKLKWRCSEGHQWEATHNSIQVGSWCPECAGLRLSINDAQQLAKKQGGKCLSKVYENCHKELKWQCSEGHQWEASYTYIQKGRWCPKCSSRQRHSIEDAQKIAKERGGKCLSTKYINTTMKLKWQCSEGHRWEAIYSSIQIGSWCPVCAGTQPLSIGEMQKIAQKRGGKCLSREYKNSNTKLKWQCSEGHVWKVKPSHIKAGSWCPECGGQKSGLSRRLSIEDAQNLAKERGGKCLSQVYKGSKSKLKWECQNGHQWESAYTNIQSGKWCPECSSYIGEKFCRLAFESLFKSKFPKSYTNWLKSKDKNRLELDGYSKKLKIAFEHHGIQHYEFHNRFHKTRKDFDNQKERDLYKKKLCKKNNIILIEIPQVPDVISLGELIPYIIQELKKNKVNTAPLNDKVPNFNEIYLKDEYSDAYNELKKIAKKKNGIILSDKYLGSKIKLGFKCKEGHIWKANPIKIKDGTWCPVCAGVQPLSIEEMQKIANERGGQCLSKEYKNNSTKLKWQCSDGHVWKVKPGHVKAGSWCPECGKIKRGVSRRLSIKDAQKLAKDCRGKCLSKKYNVAPNKLTWQCSEGHQWEATYTNIQSGKWCPECANLNRNNANKLTIEQMQLIAGERGGKCLSKAYTNTHTKIEWMCSKGHIWKAEPRAIKSGNWCPLCAGKKQLIS